MEPLLHQVLLLPLLVFLTTARLTSARPAMLGHMKSTEVTVSKEHHHRRHHGGTDSTELETLQEELQRMTHELSQTKEALESLRAQMERKLNNVSPSSPGNMEMSCRTNFTMWHETVGRSLEYLDNFDVHCSQGEFLRQWRMTWGERGKKKAIKFVCCKFVSSSSSSASNRWNG